MSLSHSDEFGRYEVLSLLGQGGSRYQCSTVNPMDLSLIRPCHQVVVFAQPLTGCSPGLESSSIDEGILRPFRHTVENSFRIATITIAAPRFI